MTDPVRLLRDRRIALRSIVDDARLARSPADLIADPNHVVAVSAATALRHRHQARLGALAFD
jgi:hypothetical protein